jgi:hypothetical protein
MHELIINSGLYLEIKCDEWMNQSIWLIMQGNPINLMCHVWIVDLTHIINN